MARFSTHFNLGKTQPELDFVDVSLDEDLPLFVDPFAISRRHEPWSRDAHACLVSFFQEVVDRIRAGNRDRALALLGYLREPNETRLGLSSGRPKGAGIGAHQAVLLYEALSQSQAVQTGFLTSLEECELMIEGIGRDKISDLTTNIIRRHLALYTKNQCELLGVPIRMAAVGPQYHPDQHQWINDYLEVPVVDGRPILLVPKVIARCEPAYDHRDYYRHFALEYLQAEHINAGSSLVHALRDGTPRVYVKDLKREYPCSKQFLFEFSRDHPEVLQEYRDYLTHMEERGIGDAVGQVDEANIARVLKVALRSIPAGAEGADAYHRAMIGILEFVFFPLLLSPFKEQEIHEGRKRIDIVMENGATTGIFHRLHDVRHIPCAYIVIECKNYTREIANPELDQIAGRFSPERGKVGLLCCRTFDARELFVRRCQDTFGDDRGLILSIDDATVLSWLDLIEAGDRSLLDTSLSRLVNEVCLG